MTSANASPDPAPQGSPARGRLIGLLRIVAGLVLLVLVGRTLPWSDQLVFVVGPGGEGGELAVEGEIVGDWKTDAIDFRHAEGVELGSGWPEGARPGADGVARDLVRTEEFDPALGGRFDWRPGMPRAFREMRPSQLSLAFLSFLAAMSFAITRWWRLLRVAGCTTSYLNAWRLTFVGMFFNLVVPGLTGGDVIKAAVVVRENPDRRADAFVSVVVDRLIGIGALAAIAMVMILFSGSTFGELRVPVLVSLVLAVGGALAYFNRPLRRALRFDALLDRLPLGAKLRALDEAVLTYGRHPGEVVVAVLLSVANHVIVTIGFIFLGRAFGLGFDEVALADWFVAVPIGNIITAVPVAPGGWGLGEYAFKFLFEMMEASPAMGVAVSVTFRLTQLAFGLVGGAFLLLPGQRREIADTREAGA